MGPAQPERCLRVLPTRARVAEALRERVREQGVALALGLIDLRSLEDRLLRAAGLEPIGTTQARLLLTAVAPEAARGTSLAALSAQPGFAESFLELWDTLRRAGVDAQGFTQLAARLSRRADSLTGRRFTALARIATAYASGLRKRGAVDGVDARAHLPAAIASLGPPRLAALVDGAQQIEVEGSAELPVIRARLWQALAAAGLRVSVEVPVLPAQLEIDSPELTASLELLRRNLVEEAPSVELRLRSLIPVEREAREARPLAPAGLIPFVSPAQARALVGPALRARLELIEAEDERAALRGVCAAIRERLAAGVPPHRITLALPRLGLARARVLAALDAAGLPREETRGQPVIRAAPLRLTLALIDAAERELPREALAQLLESAYVGRRDAYALLAALRRAGSRDDRGIGHLGRLRAYADKLALGPHPDLERRVEQAAAYQALAWRWAPLLAKLRMRQEATLREHLDAVFAALRALRIPQRCLSLPELGGGAREHRLERDAVVALARDRAALEALELAGHSLDEAARVLELAHQRVSLTDFRAHLEAALAGVRERPAGVRGAGIAIRDLQDLARSPSDHLFVLHAVEGELPGPGRGLPFLDDDDRLALDRAAGRPILASPAAADAGVFALVCAGVREHMSLISHRRDAGGREVMRSRYALALARALSPASSDEVPPPALTAGVVPPFSQASTRGQLITRVGLLLHRGELPAALLTHGALAPALGWARARARDLGRASVELDTLPRTLAHTRLDFDWAGAREAAPGLVWQGSATSLEDYAACPYRFFAKRVLELKARPPSRDELSAAELGEIRHLVLAEVMQALREEGLTPLEGGDRAGHEARLAQRVCAEVLDRWQARERTGPLPLWFLHRDLVSRDLGRMLEGERRAAIEAWEPGEFEVGFGVRSETGSGEIDGTPLEIPDREGKRRFAVVGRVDRVDYRGDGRGREGLVIDYKSGRVGDRLRYLELGRTQLQLPLYVAWLASRRPDLGDADAAYVSLRDAERSKVSLLDMILSSVELDGLLSLEPGERQLLRTRAAAELPSASPGQTHPAPPPDAGARVGPPPIAAGALDLPEFGQRNLADNLWALLGGVAAGRFDVRPHDPSRACHYCPYGPVCRVERGDELDGGDA